MKTKIFNHTKHQELWQWLADNPGKYKDDYFIEHRVPEDEIPINDCYACEGAGSECRNCPLDWDGVDWDNTCSSLGSSYDIWQCSVGLMGKHELIVKKAALKVKNMPLSPDFKGRVDSMKTYKVTIIETEIYEIEVGADDAEEAQRIACVELDCSCPEGKEGYIIYNTTRTAVEEITG
jgi:hypothetical protein